MNNTGQKFGGRQKNTPNRTTKQTKEIIQKIIHCELDNLETLLSELSPKDRVNALIKLLPFVIPKHSEIFIDTPLHNLQPITLTLINEQNEI